MDRKEDRATVTFRSRVLRIIRAVPKGHVVTYGQVAYLAGSPRAARQVGTILRGIKEDEDIPWQRVVNARGELSTYKVALGELQRALLESEGITFTGRAIDLARYRWHFDDAEG
ncbi:MAG: methylated-DNA--[protein]-cysteine S-methyltransferase [Trueperaceae bacterium]|nr:MAG: methylated-DNA--[protein]-cysteine S-methyltransferase [Trueperaceae bacterium]